MAREASAKRKAADVPERRGKGASSAGGAEPAAPRGGRRPTPAAPTPVARQRPALLTTALLPALPAPPPPETSGGDAEFPFPVLPLHTEKHGEGYAAARALRPGDLILRVAPTAAVPKTELMRCVCANCFARGLDYPAVAAAAAAARGATAASRASASAATGPAAERQASAAGAGVSGRPLVALRVCPRCQQAAHCARCEALPGAARRHADECGALKTLAADNAAAGTPGADTSAVRSLLRLLLVAAADRRPRDRHTDAADAADDEAGPESDAEFGSDDVIVDGPDDVDGLCGNPEDLPGGEAVFDAYVCVVKQARLLAPAWARAGLASGLRLQTLAHFNAFDVTAPAAEDSDPASCAQGATLGEGVFASAARFNHACAPAARLQFDAWGCLRVSAARAIAAGEEITITYTDSNAPVAARRAALAKVYCFDCDCGKCACELRAAGAGAAAAGQEGGPSGEGAAAQRTAARASQR